MEQLLLLLPGARLAVLHLHVCCLCWGQPLGAWLCSAVCCQVCWSPVFAERS